MTDSNAALRRVVVPDEELELLVRNGRARGGVLTQDEVLDVVTVELTTDVLARLVTSLAVNGVTVEEPDEDPMAEDEALVLHEPAASGEQVVESVLRKRTMRITPDRADGRSAGTSSDPVRMYLKEIGRVPLLT